MEHENIKTSSLTAKLAEIMKECSHVLKNGKNDFHGYKYATCADVLEMVNNSLSSHNICSLVTPELLRMDEVVTAKGGKEHLATVKMDISLIDGETGESVTITGIGSGQDNGDKAVMKAQTAAIKYAYVLSFAISMDDVPEDEKSTGWMNENEAPFPSNRQTQSQFPTGSRKESFSAHCSDCGAVISDKVSQFSEKRFGRPLCMKCQHGERGTA